MTLCYGRCGSRIALLAVMALCACSHKPGIHETGWKPSTAAQYLDQREAWWIKWPHAARDHGTFCVSCHTALPYALARPALSKALGEMHPPDEETELLENVRKRVQLWNIVEPYYADQGAGPYKAAQSRGTESILNALVLASWDAREGGLSPDGKAAFVNMWKLQEVKGAEQGAWQWLEFGNEPFEGHDSDYYGAALAAVATGVAPDNYRSSPEIQTQVNLLRGYLNRHCADQSLINRATALWASVELPGVLSRKEQDSINAELFSRQRGDGGWSLASLSWGWRDWSTKALIKLWFRSNTPLLTPMSDGYATGLIAYVLERQGLPRDNPHLKHALGWLEKNQNRKEGFWPSSSLNNHVDPSSDKGRFMSDAATAYAVLALAESQSR